MPRSPEQNPIPAEARETREPKVDFDWDKHMKVQLGEARHYDGWVGRQLEGLVIEGPKGSIDVLENLGNNNLIIRNEKESGGAHYKEEIDLNKGVHYRGKIDLNKFDNLVDLAVLLHELGHVDQYRDKNVNRDILLLSGEARAMLDSKKDFLAAGVDIVKHMIEVFPELEGKIDLVRALGFFSNRAKVMEVAMMAVKIMERDATARALKRFREISDKTGIDFFKKFKVEKAVDPDSCQNSIQEGMTEPDKFEETDVVQELNNRLKTYHAETLTDTYDPVKTGKRIKPKLNH